MKQNLFQITADQRLLIEALEETGGEITPEIEAAMAITAENFERKAEAYSATIAECKATEAAIADELRRLTAYRKTMQNIQARMRERLTEAMKVFEVQKMTAGTYRLSLRRSTAVAITDEEAIPDSFFEYEPKLKRDELRKALLEGAQIEGAQIEEKTTIQIR